MPATEIGLSFDLQNEKALDGDASSMLSELDVWNHAVLVRTMQKQEKSFVDGDGEVQHKGSIHSCAEMRMRRRRKMVRTTPGFEKQISADIADDSFTQEALAVGGRGGDVSGETMMATKKTTSLQGQQRRQPTRSYSGCNSGEWAKQSGARSR